MNAFITCKEIALRKLPSLTQRGDGLLSLACCYTHTHTLQSPLISDQEERTFFIQLPFPCLLPSSPSQQPPSSSLSLSLSLPSWSLEQRQRRAKSKEKKRSGNRRINAGNPSSVGDRIHMHSLTRSLPSFSLPVSSPELLPRVSPSHVIEGRDLQPRDPAFPSWLTLSVTGCNPGIQQTHTHRKGIRGGRLERRRLESRAPPRAALATFASITESNERREGVESRDSQPTSLLTHAIKIRWQTFSLATCHVTLLTHSREGKHPADQNTTAGRTERQTHTRESHL